MRNKKFCWIQYFTSEYLLVEIGEEIAKDSELFKICLNMQYLEFQDSKIYLVSLEDSNELCKDHHEF